jgi:hypothetical protein
MTPNLFRLVVGWALLCALGYSSLAKDKPEAILFAAKKPNDTRAWSVQAHVNATKSMKISGIVFGKDFDLTIETLDGVTRQITLGEKNWSSADGGKTWKATEKTDRRFYYLAHTPIKPDETMPPPFEALGTEKVGSESFLHIRFIAPDKVTYEGDRPNYWIETPEKGPPVIRRYYGPAAFENEYINERVEYSLVTEKNPIVAPPGNPLAAAPAPGPERLLMTALKKMTIGVWAVKGTATFTKTLALQGLLEGANFDMTMEPGNQPNVPMREIMIGDKAWICSDGKTWHASVPEDRLVYNITHTPIMHGRLQPPYEKVGNEERNGVAMLHIKMTVPDAKVQQKDLPHFWLVLDAQGEPLYVGHAEIPMISRGSTDVTYCAFDYAPSKEKIAPPPKELITKAAPPAAEAKEDAPAAPVDDAVHGFAEIEAHKAEWSGKVVRVEVTPKLLQALEISKGNFRVMLKDTSESAISYGQVDFPGDALVKLGFLKKALPGNHGWTEFQELGALGRTEGAPVSFYVRIVNLGAKPAARCVAMGSKYSAKGGYTW